MQFKRLFLVVTTITMLGGLFGCLVGALLGCSGGEVVDNVLIRPFAYNPAHHHPVSDNQAIQVGIGMGTGFGLIAGALIALALGVLDQLLVAGFALFAKPKAGPSQPAEEPNQKLDSTGKP